MSIKKGYIQTSDGQMKRGSFKAVATARLRAAEARDEANKAMSTKGMIKATIKGLPKAALQVGKALVVGTPGTTKAVKGIGEKVKKYIK